MAIVLFDLIQSCKTLLESGIPKSVNFEVNIDDADMKVYADATQIEQVILNLVTNALEAIPDAGGDINLVVSRVHFSNNKVFVHGSILAGEYACIEVRDSGCGIDSAKLERIFEPFYSTKELGNGMGLAMLRGIVLEHGGVIDAHSIEGEGSTFSVYLPLTQVEVDKETTLKPSAFQQGVKRVLIIDDQEEILEVLRLMLEELGHEVIVCGESTEVSDLLAANHENLDLVITDYSMPDVDGLHIANHCNEIYPELPVVITTGYGDSLPGQSTSGIALRILHKPYELAELRQVLRETTA